MSRHIVCWLSLILFLLAFTPAMAKPVDLKTIALSLTTEHGILDAEIHFDSNDIEVAKRVESIIKKDLIKIINYFGYVPKTTVHFNLNPYIKLSNGNARVFPSAVINLYNYPANYPEHLISIEDWMRGLIFHEFFHITHMDQVRGYLDIGKRIFGSIAKIPATIVPRWFTEGGAVWAESRLLGMGRLNNPLFTKDLVIQMLRADYCKTIDCLDEPGKYPNLSLPYWAGAHFIDYLENLKPGTFKCLVYENADQLPFFLNNAFLKCTDKTAQEHFSDFRKKFLLENASLPSESQEWGNKITNVFGSDNLEKGIILDGNHLYKVETDKHRSALVSYDLDAQMNLSVGQFSYPINELSSIIRLQLEKEEADSSAKYLVASFVDDPNFREYNKTWKLINAETLLVEKNIAFAHRPAYVVAVSESEFITASYDQSQWHIHRQKFDKELNFVSAQRILVLPTFANLVYLKAFDKRVFLKINDGEKTSLYLSDENLEKFTTLYESTDYFDLPFVTSDFFILRDQKKIKLFEFGLTDESFKVSSLEEDLLKNVAEVFYNNNYTLVLENRLKSKETNLNDIRTILKSKATNPESIKTTSAPLSFRGLIDQSTTKVENFPKMYHLSPNYWFFATGNSENLSSFGLTTGLSDPMDIHNIGIVALTYPEEKKFGGSVLTTHKVVSVDDNWQFVTLFDHEYSKNEFTDYLNSESNVELGTQYNVLLKRWTWIPSLFVGYKKVNDFLSDRNFKKYGVGSIFNYQAMSYDDLFQNFFAQVKVQNNIPNLADSFIELFSYSSFESRFTENFSLGGKVSYGKLFKNNFRSGVIYGGGTTDLNSLRAHDFYGIPYSNVYGNEIFTARVFVDYNFWNIYRGKNLIPIYFKELHLLLGREMIYADRIFIKDNIYRDKMIQSAFIGPRLKMNLFYHVPVDLDLIYSSIARPDQSNANQIEFSVKAEI